MNVSILMPAFNAEQFIASAIESVLHQTHQNFEFIIVNDGSRDNTLSIINSYSALDRRIKIISHENMGMGNSLNKALEVAKSELIARMDADDIMMPNRIERQLQFIQNNPEVAVLSCLVYYIDRFEKIIGKNSSDLRTIKDFESYLTSNRIIGLHHPGVMMKKSVVKSVGGYRGQYWPADDIDLWNRISEKGHVILVQQEYLMKYRLHGSSVSINSSKKANLMTSWVKENMKRRRMGEQELSLQEFIDYDKAKPLFVRINSKRKVYAKILYKKAVHYYSLKQLFRSVVNLLMAFSLQPFYIFKQIGTKFFNFHF